MKAHFEAYGCTLNIGESRELEERFLSLGWELTDSPDDADIVVLSTCIVVAKTERKMLKRIEALSSAPRLVVTGCIASARTERARALAPDAEFVPPHDLDRFGSCLLPVGPSRAAAPRDAYSIVPLGTGCRGECSYCITRFARGGLRSRTADRIVRSVSSAVKDGPREIRLTAQDTASYGSDIGLDLPSLVSNICALPQDFRLRIGMMNPKSVLPVVSRIADMYGQPKVFKFLHLPVQSGSDRVLGLMNRGYTTDEFLGVVETVRSMAPDLSLSTDIIIGYPCETDSDHRANLDIIVKARPDVVNVTKFSARPGTKAAEFGERVDGATVKERSRQITKVRFEVALRINRSWVGREVRTLATEHVKDGSTVLRTDEYRQVVVRETLRLGEFYTVGIEDATPTYLTGRRVGSP